MGTIFRNLLKSIFSVITFGMFVGCMQYGYRNNGKEVSWESWDEARGQMSSKVDADPKTFKSLQADYGIDSTHVFYRGHIIAGADPDSFRVFRNGYACDNNRAYYRGNAIADSDGQSFKSLNEWYACDNYRVYSRGKVVKHADPASFKVHTACLTEDKDDFYWEGKKLNVQDKSTFTVMGEKDSHCTLWAKDRYNGYFMGDGSVIHGIDCKSFRPVVQETYIYSKYYAADKDNVYYKDQVVDGADPSTFKEVDYMIGQDVNGMYHGARITQVKDYSRLKRVGQYMYADSHHVYDADYNILEDADVDSFRHIRDLWYMDKNHVWWSNRPLPSADVITFSPAWKTYFLEDRQYTSESSHYGCDKNHVYFRDSIIEGADPATFWLVDLNDGNGWIAYDMKKIHKGKDTPAFRQYLKEKYTEDFLQ